jgi:hypothetical protein
MLRHLTKDNQTNSSTYLRSPNLISRYIPAFSCSKAHLRPAIACEVLIHIANSTYYRPQISVSESDAIASNAKSLAVFKSKHERVSQSSGSIFFGIILKFTS